ncbi:MAG TPA: class I SAM-dependent methyltransferase [Polyangiaceae bacterium]|nr:class I SAM-dependent methyltransferase [Polyangiaceae bacterium]
MALGRLTQVLRDRRNKAEMADASYWDARATSRSGYARSVWHSETFSEAWDERQRELLRGSLEASLGSLAGKRLADVGCGTGRISRHFAALGAEVTGYDFSPATVAAAEREAAEAGLAVRFVVADVSAGRLPGDEGSFDGALSVGCLAVACRDAGSLDAALAGIARLVRPGGVVHLLEPIHTSRLLGRLLRLPVDAWVEAAGRAGLALEGVEGMGLWPVRLALASFDLPAWLVRPVFFAGERALGSLPALERAGADYKLLRLRRER